MNNKKLKKMAAEDARQWAYAEMFFGEGAGTRRKLLSATIAAKVERISGYHELFQKEYAKQDFSALAIRAAKERRRIDGSHFIKRNLGALARGDRRGMSNGFAAAVIVASVAHTTGYDKKVIEFAKDEYRDVKNRYNQWRGKHVTVTNLK